MPPVLRYEISSIIIWPRSEYSGSFILVGRRQLASASESSFLSKKGEFATTTEEATFTVSTYEDVDSWRIIIAIGMVRHVGDGDTTHRVPDLFPPGN